MVEAEGATLEIVAPTIGGVQMNDGKSLKADHKFAGGPSVLFDAVAILNATALLTSCQTRLSATSSVTLLGI